MLGSLLDVLPDEQRAIARAQFSAYDLVQREVDGRALNFYCRNPQAAFGPIPKLAMDVAEARVARVAFQVAEDAEPVHATLTAVNGRVFSVAFSRRVDKYPRGTEVRLARTKRSKKSG
ncbi:hypothetical protein ACO2Q9_00290 [Variovorax sp. VNK109]|uniref:hypothetical protein n=1 Tax=Variovorax sp. VNK109 TaxID=3400919 RepID=UPI003C07BFE8